MKYLVTGGAGFIGSHLAEALVEGKNEVVVLDDFSTGNKKNLDTVSNPDQVRVIEGSILDAQLVESLVKECDGVFHLAAAVGVKKILDDPIGSLKTNVEGSENVLVSATKHKKRVLLASTSEIYGKNDSGPLTEESDRILGSPLLSRWTYSEAKAIDEALARVLYLREGLKVQTVRFFNTVGPRQSPAYGMVIPRFFAAAKSHEPLRIYGDGSQQRVFCHISDAVSGVLALWNSNKGFGEAFNLGGFQETTILELAKEIISMAGSNSGIEFVPYEQLLDSGFEDMKRRLPVTTKLQNLTGWKATKDLNYILADLNKDKAQ
jgi:UDP-glucose 4-epimerase